MRIFSIILLGCFWELANIYAQTENITDNNGLKQGAWTKYHPNGNIWYQGIFKDDHPVGEFNRYYPDGNIKASMEFDVTGINARVKLFYKTGKLAASGNFHEQKNDSLWKVRLKDAV